MATDARGLCDRGTPPTERRRPQPPLRVAAPELRHLAKKTWAKDPVRIRSPDLMEAADEVAKLPDVWAGKHVEHWRRANDG